MANPGVVEASPKVVGHLASRPAGCIDGRMTLGPGIALRSQRDSVAPMRIPCALPVLFTLMTGVPSVRATEPAPLSEARANYERAVEKAKAPLQTQYRKRLNQLLQQFTKSGNLDGAVSVKKEIQALWLEGDWSLSGEKTGKTEPVWFDTKGRCTSGTWIIPEGVVTTSSNAGGWSLKFELPGDEKEPIRVVSYHSGRAVENMLMRRTATK